MEKKKQSSVEWLKSAMNRIMEKNNIEVEKIIWEQAKAMHRKEIEEAYVYGVAFQIDIKNGLSPIFYYNDRFGGQDNE